MCCVPNCRLTLDRPPVTSPRRPEKGGVVDGEATGEPSDKIRARVEDARTVQRKRFGHPNTRMSPKEIKAHCTLDDECQELLKMAMTELNLSARAYDRILKVSRTIADLDHANPIKFNHISEATQYRSLGRQFWL